MDRDEIAAPRRRFRLPLVLGLGVAIVAAGWSVVWTVARGRILAEIDARLAGSAARGVDITCADRQIGGFPFRMELTCRAPGIVIRDRDVRASASALRVVAQVWDPRLVLVEVDGPGNVDGDGGATAATWRDLRASLRWSGDGVRRISLAAEGLDVTVKPREKPPVRLSAAHAELHGRPSGAAEHDLDLAASLASASLTIAGERIGPPKSDIDVSTTLIDFLPPGPGSALPAFADRGGRMEPVKLSLAVGGIVVAGEGALVLDGGGSLDGMITLVARGLETFAKGGAEDLGLELTAVLTGFVVLGKAPKDPAQAGRRLELIVDHGDLRIGRVKLGRIPPLFRGN